MWNVLHQFEQLRHVLYFTHKVLTRLYFESEKEGFDIFM